MLSRVAERVYWLGRYLERSEDTASLISVVAHSLMDIPRHVPVSWDILIHITASEPLFHKRYRNSDERNVVKFLLADKDNPYSIINSLTMARENARTTREIMPVEAWELINDLYWFTSEQISTSMARSHRNVLLDKIVARCHRLTGLLIGTLSENATYHFLRLGRNLERADMTSRIIDTGVTTMTSLNESDVAAYEDVLWMNALHALNANQMYRQHVPDRVNGEDVVAFLLRNPEFPRSVALCLAAMKSWLQHLPNNDLPLRRVARLQRQLRKADVKALVTSGMHEFVDTLQAGIGQVHEDVSHTWFNSPQEK